MNKKQVIKITESDLHRMVSEAVKAVLKEDYEAPGFEDDDDFANDDREFAGDYANDGLTHFTPERNRKNFTTDKEFDDMDDDNFRRALDSASKRYLHRKGSLNREV